MTFAPSPLGVSSRRILAWFMMLPEKESFSKIRRLYAEDEALQLDLRVASVATSVVDDRLVVELEITDVTDDAVVICLSG